MLESFQHIALSPLHIIVTNGYALLGFLLQEHIALSPLHIIVTNGYALLGFLLQENFFS
jgi:hypothetical protein